MGRRDREEKQMPSHHTNSHETFCEKTILINFPSRRTLEYKCRSAHPAAKTFQISLANCQMHITEREREHTRRLLHIPPTVVLCLYSLCDVRNCGRRTRKKNGCSRKKKRTILKLKTTKTNKEKNVY